MKISFKNEKQKDPMRQNGVKVHYSGAKRGGFRKRWYFILLLIFSPVIAFLWYGFGTTLLINADGILTTEPIFRKAPEIAYVTDVFIKVGDEVDIGTPMIRLTSPVLDNEIEQLQQQISDKEAAYSKEFDKIKLLYQQKEDNAKSNLDKQVTLADIYKKFDNQGVLSLADRSVYQQQLTLATATYDQAKIDHENAIYAYQLGQIAQSISDYKLKLSQLQARYGMLTIRPIEHRTIYDLLVSKGDLVNVGDPLVRISNRLEPIVTVYIDPKDMAYAKVGQQATVTLPNGNSFISEIKEPTNMIEKKPALLTGAFEGDKPVIKVKLSFPQPFNKAYFVEGLPVKVRFHYKMEQKLTTK